MILFVWLSFISLILVLIAIDLGVFHRSPGSLTIAEALRKWFIWVACALLFNVYIYFLYDNNWLGWGVTSVLDLNGRQAALQFFAGYVIELSLSVDNVFVIAMIFQYLRIPDAQQYRVLFWGILGAIVMRAVMIVIGAALISRFSWVSYVFGGILILSAARMLALRSDISVDKISVVRIARRVLPFTKRLYGGRFFILRKGRLMATPLFLALLIIEWADVIFAVDSVPAIFAVTRDPFLVFTSNIFAILGLRTLFFVVAGMIRQFRYVKVGLVFILTFVGLKLILEHRYDIPIAFSLAFIAMVMTVSVLASMWHVRQGSSDG